MTHATKGPNRYLIALSNARYVWTAHRSQVGSLRVRRLRPSAHALVAVVDVRRRRVRNTRGQMCQVLWLGQLVMYALDRCGGI